MSLGTYIVCGVERVELELALRRLGETFETDLVVSTAGGILNGALLRAGLVDEELANPAVCTRLW